MQRPFPTVGVRPGSQCTSSVLWICLTLGALSPAQAADDVAAASTTTASDNTIQVQANHRDYDARQYDTAGKIVIPHDQLVKAGDTEISETLKRLPGVTVSSNGDVSLRGMTNGYTQLLVNGEKMLPGFSLDSLSPELVDHVEIIRTASADSAGQAIAGTINIVLKRRAKSAQRSMTTTVEGGDDFAKPSVGWHLADRNPDYAWTLDGTASDKYLRHRTSELDAGSDSLGNLKLWRTRETTKPVQTSSLSLSPTVQWSPTDLGEIAIESFLKADHAVSVLNTTSHTLLGANDLHDIDTQRNRANILYTRHDVSWTVPLANEDKLALKLELSTQQRNNVFRETGADATDTPNLDTVVFSHIADQGLTQTGSYTFAPWGSHTMATGWRTALAHRAETRDEYALGYPGIAPIDSNDAYQTQTQAYALYAQDDWQATPHLAVNAGLRWEWLETHSTGDTFATVRKQMDAPCPDVQLVWKLSDERHDQLRLALARTFNAPAIAKLVPRLYTSTNNSPVDPDFQGNPHLLPELAMGPDIAYEIFPQDGATLSVGAYARRIQNDIRQDISLVNGRWLLQSINAGDARTHGVELDAKLPASLLWSTKAALVFSGNLTRNWSSVDNVPGPANTVAEQVPLSGTFAVDYTSLNGQYSFGTSLSYQRGGWQRVSDTLFTATARRDELAVYGLWHPTKRMQLKLSLENLLHQPWTDTSGYMDANGRQTATREESSHASMRLAFDWTF